MAELAKDRLFSKIDQTLSNKQHNFRLHYARVIRSVIKQNLGLTKQGPLSPSSHSKSASAARPTLPTAHKHSVELSVAALHLKKKRFNMYDDELAIVAPVQRVDPVQSLE